MLEHLQNVHHETISYPLWRTYIWSSWIFHVILLIGVELVIMWACKYIVKLKRNLMTVHLILTSLFTSSKIGAKEKYWIELNCIVMEEIIWIAISMKTKSVSHFVWFMPTIILDKQYFSIAYILERLDCFEGCVIICSLMKRHLIIVIGFKYKVVPTIIRHLIQSFERNRSDNQNIGIENNNHHEEWGFIIHYVYLSST